MSEVALTIDWQGIALSVAYQPNWCGMHVHHIELHVIEPIGAVLPVTDTGYRSHFFSDAVEAYGGPAAYVRAWLDEAAKAPAWQRHYEKTRQLTLL